MNAPQLGLSRLLAPIYPFVFFLLAVNLLALDVSTHVENKLETVTFHSPGRPDVSHSTRRDVTSTWGHKHLGTPTNPETILPSLTPFATERFLHLRQIVVNCFNSKGINSVHLMAISEIAYNRIR